MSCTDCGAMTRGTGACPSCAVVDLARTASRLELTVRSPEGRLERAGGLELPPEFAGRYAITRLLGEGAAGMVVLATDQVNGRPVAVKVLKRLEETDRARFLAEGRLLARLADPHIVQVYDVGTLGDHPYLVTAYQAGGSLTQRLENGAFSVDEAARVALDLLAGLSVCHAAGVVHRDLKPDNVLFGEDGSARLADFGIARHFEQSTRHTATGALIGTPLYMAPEQVRGEEAGTAADVYAVGLILYEMLTGVRACEGVSLLAVIDAKRSSVPDVRARAPGVPEPVARVIATATAVEPADRPQTAQGLRLQLERALARADRARTVSIAAPRSDAMKRAGSGARPVPGAAGKAPETRGMHLVVALAVGAAFTLAALGMRGRAAPVLTPRPSASPSLSASPPSGSPSPSVPPWAVATPVQSAAAARPSPLPAAEVPGPKLSWEPVLGPARPDEPQDADTRARSPIPTVVDPDPPAPHLSEPERRKLVQEFVDRVRAESPRDRQRNHEDDNEARAMLGQSAAISPTAFAQLRFHQPRPHHTFYAALLIARSRLKPGAWSCEALEHLEREAFVNRRQAALRLQRAAPELVAGQPPSVSSVRAELTSTSTPVEPPTAPPLDEPAARAMLLLATERHCVARRYLLAMDERAGDELTACLGLADAVNRAKGPERPLALFLAGSALVLRDAAPADLERACGLLLRCHALKPDPLVLYRLAQAEALCGRVAPAIAFLERALEFKPDWYDAMLLLAVLYDKLPGRASMRKAHYWVGRAYDFGPEHIWETFYIGGSFSRTLTEALQTAIELRQQIEAGGPTSDQVAHCVQLMEDNTKLVSILQIKN